MVALLAKPASEHECELDRDIRELISLLLLRPQFVAEVRDLLRPTTLAAHGASLTEIRDALGQSTLHMAAHYTHLASEHLRKRIDSLPALGPAVVPLGSRTSRRSA